MDRMEMDKKAIGLLSAWDPLEKGEGAYEEEIQSVVEALHEHDHPADLAKSIREIYEKTSSLWIPLEECVQISYKLVAVKYEAEKIV